MTLISLSAIVCEVGPVASATDWWPMARAIAEGAVLANMAWMTRRNLAELDLEVLGVRYMPRPAVRIGEVLGQGIRLAPALVQDREGSCIDLACHAAALRRLRGQPDARVEFCIDELSQRGHAVVLGRDFSFDPTHLLTTQPRAKER